MVQFTLNGIALFYWQSQESVPLPGDLIEWKGITYRVKWRIYSDNNITIPIEEVSPEQLAAMS